MQMYPNVMFEIKQWSNLCSKSLLYQVYTNYIYIYTFGERKKSIQMEHILPSLQPTVTTYRNRAPQLDPVSMLCCWSMFIWELYLNLWVFVVPLLVIPMKVTSTAHTPSIHI